jgi:hypothetical protein
MKLKQKGKKAHLPNLVLPRRKKIGRQEKTCHPMRFFKTENRKANCGLHQKAIEEI